MGRNSNRVVVWWGLVLAGAAGALLIAWAARAVHVRPATLYLGGGVVVALSWLVVLVTVPWNLYFAARRAAQEIVVSRERGIEVRAGYDAEAARIARRMLRFALGAHLGTAIAAAAVAYATSDEAGYYIAGAFAAATAFRPATAYYVHLRERLRVITRETTYPRNDVVTLIQQTGEINAAVSDLRSEVSRIAGTQEADRRQASARSDALERRIDHIVRRIEATLDGLTDHQELLGGLRALVRMVRSA